MKSVKLRILFLAVITLAGIGQTLSVQAQTSIDCADGDEIAICFDNGDINGTVSPNIPFTIYYCIVNASEPWIAGFEFSLTEPVDPYFRLSESFPVAGINVGTFPDYVVGLAEPLPVTSEPTVIMTQQAMVIDTNPRYYFLQPSSIPSIPGRLVYSTWDGSGDYPLVPMDPISGDFAQPVAQFNGSNLNYCNSIEPLDLIVNLGFESDNDNLIGTSLGATDGFDADYDLPDADVTLTFPHPEWNQAATNFKQDVKAAYDPTLELKQWTFVATTQGDPFTDHYAPLNFQANFSVQPDVVFTLYDRDTGLSYDLFTTNTVYFAIPAGSTFSHTFDLAIGHLNAVDPALWVDVTASGNGLSEQPNRLSTNSLATDGYDPDFDTPEPIHPPSKYVASSFTHADWPLGPRFQTDARALFDPAAAAKTWDLRVETDQVGPITLDFAANFSVQDSVGLHLRDLRSGQTFDLLPQLNYVFFANGFSSYDFEIIVGVSGPPDLNPASRQLNAGWALVGLPLEPAGATLNQVILDQAAGYAFMFGHQPGQGYELLDPTATAQQDRGYWIGTDAGFVWTMSGNRNLSGQVIPLAEGWNLIGNPLWFPAPFEGMMVLDGGNSIPWLDAVTLGLVATGVQSYDQATDTYFNAIDLQPWEGYWINALQPGLQLAFHWQNFQVLPARLSANKSELPADPRIWSTQLTLWDANRQQASITVGVDPAATDGFDSRFDMPLPPAPPSGGPLLAFSHPEWQLASGAYFSHDVQAPSDGDIAWRAVAQVSQPGSANLTWDSSNWPQGTDYQLYLPTENRVIVMSMREQSSVRLDLGSDPLPLVMRSPSMVSGVDDTPAMAYRIGVYPNPFNPMTTISFDLPQAGEATVHLFSVRGELIAVLGGEHYAAGSHKLVWQGRDRAGHDVPSGSYFAKLYVDGEAAGSVTKMSLIR